MENAIIMASGLGTRLLPMTLTTPKPLIKVHGVPMIETIIEGLTARGVDSIYVVTGHLAEQFDYLPAKYPHIKLINNPYYKTINNISSVYVAREVLELGDCFVCEADLFVADKSIFLSKLEASCYYGRMTAGYTDDWVFDLDEHGFISRVGKKGADCYCMVGVAWLKSHDAHLLKGFVEAAFGTPGSENMFWDDVVNKHLNELKLHVHPIKAGQIVEIDTISELEEENGGNNGES